MVFSLRRTDWTGLFARSATVMLLGLHCSIASADDRSMAAIAAASDGAIERLMELPKHKSETWVYDSYFSSADAGFQKNYEDTWRYHESRLPFESHNWHGEFYQMGTLNAAGKSPMEAQVRSGFAQGYLRVRLNDAVKNAFAPKIAISAEMKKTVQQVQRKMEQVKNTTVSFTKAPEGPKLQFGYDVLTDFSKVELIAPAWGFGIYQHRLSAALGGTATADTLVLQVRGSLGKDLPYAAVTYRPRMSIWEGSLSRALSPTLSASISTAYVFLPASVDSSYGMSLAIQMP